MPRAILQNGEIRALEPLPDDWQEGDCLRVEKADDGNATADQIDRDFALLAQVCAESDAAEERLLWAALEQARAQSKAQVRRQMGLEG